MPNRERLYNKSISYIFFVIFFVTSCKSKDAFQHTDFKIEMSPDKWEQLMELPLSCIQREFPNKLNQVLADSSEMDRPRLLHPAFFGCFDWHSAVHGHWLLVQGLIHHPQHPNRDKIIDLLTENLSKENIKKELAYFKRQSSQGFERTYGWAWLLKLSEALSLWDDPTAKQLHKNLEPLTQFIVQAFLEYLPKIRYPIRGGEHTQSAFGMRLALEYALSAEEEALANLIRDRALEFYLEDGECPIGWEPSGHDFLSPCFEELLLMSMVLNEESFHSWATDFMPTIFKKNFELDRAEVTDRKDGKLVHLDGYNFSRAACMFELSNHHPSLEKLRKMAHEHVITTWEDIFDSHYSGEHWLGTFALMAILASQSAPHD